MSKLAIKLGWCALGATLWMAVGCGGGTVKNNTSLPDPLIQFLHGSPDAGNLDYYINDEPKVTGLPYLAANPDFISVPFSDLSEDEQAYDIDVRPSGGSEELDRFALPSELDTATMITTIGLRNPGDELLKRARIVFTSIRRVKPIGNRARLIVLHGLVAAPGDLTPNIDFRTPGETPIINFANIKFADTNLTPPPGERAEDPIVDAGTFTFQAQRTGLDTRTIYAEAEVTLLPGRIYFALVSGIVGDPDPLRRPRITFIELTSENR